MNINFKIKSFWFILWINNLGEFSEVTGKREFPKILNKNLDLCLRKMVKYGKW